MTTPSPTPEAEYQRLRDERDASATHVARVSAWVSNARLAVFIAFLAGVFFAFVREQLHPGWTLLLAVGFTALLVWHDRLIREEARYRAAVAFFDRGLARVRDAWHTLPTPEAFVSLESHPYGEDLDCLGRGSLFHRISEARTRAGQSCLAGWLLAPAEPSELASRHGAVAELSRRLDLRERVAGVAGVSVAALDVGSFVAWGAEPRSLPDRVWPRVVGSLLSFLSMGALVLWVLSFLQVITQSIGPGPLLLMLLIQTGFAALFRQRVRAVMRDADVPSRDLEGLAELISAVEEVAFESPRMRAIQDSFRSEAASASSQIASLRRLINLLDARRNQFFAPIGGLLLWSTQLSFAIEDWRSRHGPALENWVTSLGAFEALLSLGGYAFERPEDVFPEIVEGPVRFEAEGLAHALLPESAAVRNDVELGIEPRLLVISGSNMSGKSTLLRAVGTSVVLALAGAPVCARRLRLTPVQLAASVHVQDSLLAGHSRFYAEVRRLRRVYTLASAREGLPVLYLLDEVLHGTNAEERRIGADRLTRALLETTAAGLVTTHDLALTELADQLVPRARNAHFVDQMGSDGLMFDYKLRSGPATTGNALALMRSEGLPV